MKTTDYNIDYRLFTAERAIKDIEAAIPGTHIDAFYRGNVEPSIIVVIPGVRIVDGRLTATDDNGAIGGGG